MWHTSADFLRFIKFVLATLGTCHWYFSFRSDSAAVKCENLISCVLLAVILTVLAASVLIVVSGLNAWSQGVDQSSCVATSPSGLFTVAIFHLFEVVEVLRLLNPCTI